MQIHKPACVGLGCRPIQFRGKLGLSISAMLYLPFRREPPFALWTEPSMWSFLGKQMAEPLIDEGVLKTMPEYLVHAVAFPPQKNAAACAVRARVGGREKTLVVHGDRVWNGSVAGAAAPFDLMPLDWSRAYGGPDFAANPVGKGRGPDGPQPRALPNTEYAVSPLTRPDEEIVPAGFGRLDPMWLTRARHRGTYDENWLPQHAPGFPPDLHWRHFNMAPPDQWFNKPLVGDEPFEFEHLHETKKIVGGRLPGLRCRAFVRYRGGAHAGKLRDVPLQLSTLWFFPHAERAVLIFQGLADIAEDDAADVAVLMGAVERVGEARSDAHYLEVLGKREHPQLGGLYALMDSDLLPAGVDNVDPDMAAIEADYKVEGFLGEAQHRGAEVKVERARQRVKELGLDPDQLGVKMPPREPVPTLSELPAYLERALVTATAANKQAIAQAQVDIRKAAATARANGIDVETAQVRGPPRFSAGAELRKLIAVLAHQPDIAAGARELLAAAPKLAQAEAATRMAYLASAHLQVPAGRRTDPGAARLRELVLLAAAEGTSMARWDLTGADLSRLDLRGADLQNAHLESADLSGTRLAGARLRQAVLAHATLTGADFSDADLSCANLGAGTLAGARFERADLTGAILSCAALDGTSFKLAKLAGVQLLETKFGACDWSGAAAPALCFIKADLTGLLATGADLAGCNFIECRLDGIRFGAARLVGANFLKCSAVGAHWAGADLAQAVFTDGCDLSRGDFTQANLAQANLRGARLAEGVLAGARLDGADLSEADLGGADLRQATLRAALLVRTALAHARAAQSNWMNAIAQKADLRGADLSASNLFAMDLSQARLDQSTGVGNVLADRVKIHPKRRPAPTEVAR